MVKIRDGFVTNSSSSSFIVKIPLENKGVEFDIKDIESLKQWFVDYYSYGDISTFDQLMEDEPIYNCEYDEMMEIINSGFGIIYGSISNDDYYSDLERLASQLGVSFEWVT